MPRSTPPHQIVDPACYREIHQVTKRFYELGFCYTVDDTKHYKDLIRKNIYRDMELWAKDKLKDEWSFAKHEVTSRLRFFFKNPNDALLFKMTWC